MLSLEMVRTMLLSSTTGQFYSLSKGCPPACSESNPWLVTKEFTMPLDVLNSNSILHASKNGRSAMY